jgi:hypothetical protein
MLALTGPQGWMNLRASWGFRAAAKRGQHLVDDRLDVI